MEIKITVDFSIPPHFKFIKKLENSRHFLSPPNFSITKIWTKDTSIPQFLLNDKKVEISDYEKIQQFLSLIKFRYIPNRVLPIDIIKKEHQALRDVIIRRVSNKKPTGTDEVFKEIEKISKIMTSQVSSNLKETITNLDNIRLATPSSLSEMIFAFGYKLTENGFETDDYMHGSGIQSRLMFDTLYLIDKDYFQRFGWTQAAIWAIEEPESSMHSDMEARIALFLHKISNSEDNRLQIFTTSHSEILLQYSDKGFLIKKEKSSKSYTFDIDKILEETSRLGVSSWTHPLLQFPLTPLLLVEGKFDKIYFDKAIELINPNILSKIKILYLENITTARTGKTGGVQELVRYLKENSKVIENRHITPVIVVLDWDSRTHEETLKGLNIPSLKVFRWNETNSNPNLGEEFKGLERFYTDRIFDEVYKKKSSIVFKTNNKYTVKPSDIDEFKKLSSEIIEKELQKQDLKYSEQFISEIITEIKENI